MVIILEHKLEAALKEAARREGVSPEYLAADIIRVRLLGAEASRMPRDEWGRALLAAARNCGVSLPDSALSSEELYD
jgi:hypothetical protein